MTAVYRSDEVLIRGADEKKAALLMLLMFVPDSMAQTAGWQQTWEETLAAAKKEGKVTVSGPPSQELRRALPAAFKERFGITLEYIGGRSSETATKLRVERQAGVHTVDVMIVGIQTMATIARCTRAPDARPPLRAAQHQLGGI